GLATVRAVLNLMEEFPELTFIRGDAAIYEHIEKTSPGLFRRMEKMMEAGRWDVVGGTYIQPDSNLASTETLCRQFDYGLRYFESRFGKRPTVSWQADSFGHTPGWPNILQAFGMEGFTFTRPQRKQFPLAEPVFWWEGSHANRLLCYRQHWPWYCSERANLTEILDLTLTESSKLPFRNVGVLMGIGNHGGGPSRRHILDVEAWRKTHPDVEVRYSTLHGFFETLRSEMDDLPETAVPAVKGDLGYCLRGCYSSVQKFKTLYRQAEVSVVEAESTSALLGQVFEKEVAPLDDAWRAILFSAFHDILPGTSIERAMEEQSQWMGLALHQAAEARFTALNQLAARVDTRGPDPVLADHPTLVPFLVWNPRPHAFEGLVELEASADYRPIYSYENRADTLPLIATGPNGERLFLQEIATEHSSMPHVPWRKRVLVPLTLPAWGWQVVRLGWPDGTLEPLEPDGTDYPRQIGPSEICGGRWSIQAGKSLRILRDGVNFFNADEDLSLIVVDDPWGSWGGMHEETDSFCLETLREKWSLTESCVIEKGPLRAKLWTRWKGKNSWITLTFSLEKNQPQIRVEVRLLWNERSARLKLVLPCRGDIECDVPGATAARNNNKGQLPCGRWVRRVDADSPVGFASAALSDMDFTPSELRITLARATRYANDVPTDAEEFPWLPAVDCGELKFDFCLFGKDAVPDTVATSLQVTPSTTLVDAHPGELPPFGSFGQIEPSCVRLLALQKRSDGLAVRVQNRGAETSDAVVTIYETSVHFASLKPQEIRTLILKSDLPVLLSSKDST
ncbi:MAG: glycoside hydrolase family 38 C-terminal domain-containing protein, partial [Chthoniobacterales bacterium]